MKLERAKLSPEINVKFRIRLLGLNLLSVITQTRVNKDPERVPETIGERTQLAAVAPTFYQFRLLAPTPARPAPTNAPTSE
jgi:hypothetical protein